MEYWVMNLLFCSQSPGRLLNKLYNRVFFDFFVYKGFLEMDAFLKKNSYITLSVFCEHIGKTEVSTSEIPSSELSGNEVQKIIIKDHKKNNPEL